MATNGIKVNMTPSHPGDFIRTGVIEELGLTVMKAAQILGVRRATLSDMLNGKAALSPEMALRIEYVAVRIMWRTVRIILLHMRTRCISAT